MFAKSPTVAAEFKISGARLDLLPAFGSLPRFTKFWLPAVAGVSPCLPVDVGCGCVSNTEPTPFNCVGLPSEEEIFSAVVGVLSAPLLFAGLAASVVKLTGALPFWVSPTFTEVNSTLSLVA